MKYEHDWKWYAKKAKKYLKNYCAIPNGMSKKERKKEEKKRAKWKAFEKKYGFNQESVWSMDTYTAAFLCPRFAYLRDTHHTVPESLVKAENGDLDKADKRWSEVLDTLARGFYAYMKREDTEVWTTKDERLWKATLKYFAMFYKDFDD